MRNFCYLDYEYRDAKEEYVRPLCVSVELHSTRHGTGKKNFWLEDPNQKLLFKKLFGSLREKNFVFVSYSVQAEARATDALGLDIDTVRWLDLYLEYRMLLNHSERFSYGQQLKKGKPVFTKPPKPKYLRTEKDLLDDTSKPEFNLSAACYKLLKVVIDTAHKTKMRDLIISGKELTKAEKVAILQYCQEDVAYLRRLHVALEREISKQLYHTDRKSYFEDAITRGRYAVETAHMEKEGYPIAFDQTRNFSEAVPEILFELAKEINELFPEIQPFELNKKTNEFVRKEKKIRDWIEAQGYTKENWLQTDTGRPSLALDAFTKHFNYSHDYPKNNFGAQMVRLLKTKQSLNGFMPSKAGKKNFFDYVGKDGRVRPFMGIYGSQSARSQPAATGFIPLKAAWMRALIQPPKGRAICTIDYGQQEFLIAALLSEDEEMVKAYRSGDPYLYTAIVAKAAPKGATRETHSAIRDRFKSTVLGIQYQMGSHSLANKLTQDTGIGHTVDDAEELIELFYMSYPQYSQWIKRTYMTYERDGYLRLPCGWVMWGDNPNPRSVANFPVQGTGSSVMREAVYLARKKYGLKVIYTLHDALSVEFKQGNELTTVKKLSQAMQEGFNRCFEVNEPIRMDCNIWGPGYESPRNIFETCLGIVKGEKLYIDKRAKADYDLFQKYFYSKEDRDYLKGF